MSSGGETGRLDEFGVIGRYFARRREDSSVVVGIGDDAAVVDFRGATAVATDTLVSGVHFPDGLAGDAVGHRVLAVNLSDLAAMGAEPRWCTLALTVPEADHAWLEAFAAGFFALADGHGVELVGGDTTRGPLSVTVQALGEVDADRILTRGGASAGDDILVTGTLGDAAGGLDLLSRDLSDAGVPAPVARLPVPRADAARRRGCGAPEPGQRGHRRFGRAAGRPWAPLPGEWRRGLRGGGPAAGFGGAKGAVSGAEGGIVGLGRWRRLRALLHGAAFPAAHHPTGVGGVRDAGSEDRPGSGGRRRALPARWPDHRAAVNLRLFAFRRGRRRVGDGTGDASGALRRMTCCHASRC